MMGLQDKTDPEVVLRAWRTRILNGFLAIAAVAAAAGTVMTILDATSRPGQWSSVALYVILTSVLVVLAFSRRVDNRIRTWGILLVAYATGLIALATLGLGGSGRLYLLILPVIALILLGVRAGILVSAVSILTMVAFALLAEYTTLLNGLVSERNSLRLMDWLAEGGDTLMLLAVVMALLILFYRFQQRLIAKERRSQAELVKAQELLQEQNAALEQKISEATQELLKSNRIQTALYKITDAAGASRDPQEFFTQVHHIVGELMYAKNIFIALYDETSGLLSFPYFVDEKDEPFPTQPLDSFHGMTSYVIRTGESIKHGWDQFNQLVEENEVQLEGTYNEDGIGAPLKSEGRIIGAIFLQSYTRGIHYTDQDDEVLAYVAQHIATALTRLRALEAERQRTAELTMLNSVSEALVETLDIKTMTRLVGDKLREIFDSDAVEIMLFERQTNLIHVLYEYDRNEGGYIDYVEPFPLGTGLSSKVITTGQPLRLNTLEEEIANGAYFPPEIIEQGTGAFGQSWLGVPVIGADRVLGILALADTRPYAFNENHLRLMQTLSSNVGASLEKGRLFAETQRLLKETEQRNAELAIINEVQLLLASKLDLHAIYEVIGEKVREVFNVEVVDIVTYDPTTNLISMPYSYEKGDRSVITPREPYGFRLQVINSCTPLLINQNFMELASQYNNPVVTGDWPKSVLFVPLMVNEKVKGIVSIQDLEMENAFSSSDVRLLQTLANSMSVSLENARLFDETQRLLVETQQRTAELEIINRVGMALARQLDNNAIVAMVGDGLSEIFPQQMCSIALYNKTTDTISWPYFATFDGQLISQEPVALGSGLTSHVIRSRQPLVLGTLQEAEPYGVIWVYDGAEQEPKSWIGVPILVGDEATGVLAVQDMPEKRYNENDVRLLATLAASMGVALENARLYHETQRRADQMALTAEVGREMSATLDLQTVLESTAAHVHELFQARDTILRLADQDGDSFSVLVALGKYADQYRHDVVHLGSGITGSIALSGQAEIIDDLSRDERTQHVAGTPEVEEIPETMMCAPLIARERTIGLLSVYRDRPGGLFTPVDLDFLVGLARQAAISIENARLFTEVQRQKKFSEALIQTSPVAIVILDQENRVSSWNPAAEKLFGYSQAEAIGHSITDLVTNEEMRSEAMEFTRRMSQGELVHSITRRMSKDGSPVDVELLAVPVIFEEKRVGTFALYHNITELKRAEATIQESERRLADIIDFLPDATLVIDHEGKVIAWNRAIEEMTGVTAQEMLGKGDYEYSIPFYGERRPILIDLVLLPQEEVEAKYVQIRRTGEALVGETYTPALKSGARYLYATASVLHNALGNVVGAIETIRDITDRKHTEEELNLAKAAAEQANQAKSAFLANMSHELRTPLNAIIGFTRIVRRKAEGVLPEKQTENLDKVLISAEHLLNLINTVLDIAKIEAGRMDVLAANFRIGALIDLCANTTQPLLRPGVTLVKQVDENLTTIYSDQDKIRQIVLNLLSNAAKFTHTGKITLAARLDGENLCISVADTGIGISQEALPRIFKEFQQADNSTTRQYGGTGLGLSISRNLARLLGGDLTVESELGQGSTFTLVIPAKYRSKSLPTLDTAFPSGAEREPAPAPSPEIARSPESGSATKFILVIDDDPDAVYLLRENLNPQEFDILGARDGLEGVRIARERQPQAILLDIIMPGADGWQVLHDLKEDLATASIPVILLTIIDKKALGFRLGAAAYLLKPLDPVAVREALNRVIGVTPQRQKHVLVVDDDPNVADMLGQFLPATEYRLEAAPDGLAGLQAVERSRPDIILLDIIMPRLDGFAVIERLRADPKTRDLPIIVISAKELTNDESTRLKESVSLVMKKQGFEGDKLIDEINSLLKK
jgi:PAS domain S-box-containing protein